MNSDQIYGALVDYFGDLPLQLIKRDNQWLVYGVKVQSALNENRYIFVIVKSGFRVEEKTTLNQLDWVCFQTRTTDEVFQVPTIPFYPKSENRAAASDLITVIDRTKDETIYRTTNLPIKIRLLHDPKKNNSLQYPDQAKLYQALDTFRCVIEML